MHRDEDAPGFEQYVRARYPELRRLAFLLCGDWAAADDVVQTALIRCERRWTAITADDPHPYCRAAVVNAGRTWRVRLRRHADLGDAAHLAAAASGSEDRLDVLDALRRLPLGQRQVVVLRYFEGLSEAEIAELLGVSPGTVKSRASRALAALRASDLAPLADGGSR